MNCPNCGTQLPDGAAFCGECGTPIATPQPSPVPVAQSQQGYCQPPAQPDYQQQAGQVPPPPAGQVPTTAQQAQQCLPQSATNRAFAMTIYVANLLGIIFALCVRDKDNEFITHHLNNAVVILIGSFIGGLLTIALIGFVVLIYLFVMAIMGIVSAYNGDMKELPLIGKIHIVK